MARILSDLRKTLESAFRVGGAGGGQRAIEVYNGFLGRLLWTPTANRDIVVPDAAGTIVLQTAGKIDGLSPATANGQPIVFEQLQPGSLQLSDWSGYYEIGGTAPLTGNVTIVLPQILATDLNRIIAFKRMDRTAFTVTVQAPTGQTTTITGPTDLNTYGGRMTFQVVSLTASQQITNPPDGPIVFNGTTNQTFHLDSDGNGPKLKNNAGVLEVRNEADTQFANLVVNNLTVSGTTTTVNSETVEIADNILVLNSNVTTGAPTEDLGFRGLRGASTAASLKWNETTDEWQAGLEGSERPIARRRVITFTSASLTSGIAVLTHGLGVRLPGFTLYDNNEEIAFANSAKPNTAGDPLNEYRLDFVGWNPGITGTWTAVFVG